MDAPSPPDVLQALTAVLQQNAQTQQAFAEQVVGLGQQNAMSQAHIQALAEKFVAFSQHVVANVHGNGAKIPPPTKLDARRRKSVLPWITFMRNYLCNTHQALDASGVAKASMYLDSVAYAWFTNLQKTAPDEVNASAGFTTFDEFAAALV